MTGVLTDTLDAHSRRDLAGMPAAQVAAGQYDGEFMSYRSPRDWWRIAPRPDRDPVGFVIPTRNSYHPIIAYIGVLPAHRGNGYIYELLAEGTRILSATTSRGSGPPPTWATCQWRGRSSAPVT